MITDWGNEEQGAIKYHVRHEVKNDQSLKKTIRNVIEQDLEERLEVLGFKAVSLHHRINNWQFLQPIY